MKSTNDIIGMCVRVHVSFNCFQSNIQPIGATLGDGRAVEVESDRRHLAGCQAFQKEAAAAADFKHPVGLSDMAFGQGMFRAVGVVPRKLGKLRVEVFASGQRERVVKAVARHRTGVDVNLGQSVEVIGDVHAVIALIAFNQPGRVERLHAACRRAGNDWAGQLAASHTTPSTGRTADHTVSST